MKQILSTSYYITEGGRCYNSNTGKYLRGQVGKNGYLSFYLTLDSGKKKRIYAHRAVAEAYIPNPKHKTQINHIDGNKLNNYVDNLEWVTPKENQQHAIETELRRFPHVYCFNKEQKLVAEYKSVPAASKATQVSASLILQELNKEEKALSGNFYWSREPALHKVKNYPNLGRSKLVNQYTLSGKFINSYPSTGVAARALGLKSNSHIGECCRGKIPSYKGFIWKYADDIVSTLDE